MAFSEVLPTLDAWGPERSARMDEFMAHMREEEKEFLGKDLLRDDVVDIQQSDGYVSVDRHGRRPQPVITSQRRPS